MGTTRVGASRLRPSWALPASATGSALCLAQPHTPSGPSFEIQAHSALPHCRALPPQSEAGAGGSWNWQSVGQEIGGNLMPLWGAWGVWMETYLQA